MIFLKDQRGQGGLEYALILALVLAVIIVGIKNSRVLDNAVQTVASFLSGKTTEVTAGL